MTSAERTAWRSGVPLADRLLVMWQRQIGCDVTFTVGPQKEEFRAHKTVLTAGSQKLEDVFYGTDSASNDVIHVDYVDPVTFGVIIEYFYTNTATIGQNNAVELLAASKKFDLPSLTDNCLSFLVSNLNKSNIFSLLETSIKQEEPKLTTQCASLILTRSEDVLTSSDFMSLSPDALLKIVELDYCEGFTERDIFEACLRWADAECNRLDEKLNDKNRRLVLGRILNQIRFPTMPASEFTEVMASRSVLSADEQSAICSYVSAQSKGEEYTGDLPFNETPRGSQWEPFQIFKCSVRRFDEETVFGWECSGTKVDAIDFVCDGEASLYGVGLYGGVKSSQHEVQVRLLNEICEVMGDTGKITMDSDGSTKPIQVHFTSPVLIKPGVRYAVLAEMKGPDTFWGSNCLDECGARGMNVEFKSSHHCDNETDLFQGQIPELLFMTS